MLCCEKTGPRSYTLYETTQGYETQRVMNTCFHCFFVFLQTGFLEEVDIAEDVALLEFHHAPLNRKGSSYIHLSAFQLLGYHHMQHWLRHVNALCLTAQGDEKSRYLAIASCP